LFYKLFSPKDVLAYQRQSWYIFPDVISNTSSDYEITKNFSNILKQIVLVAEFYEIKM